MTEKKTIHNEVIYFLFYNNKIINIYFIFIYYLINLYKYIIITLKYMNGNSS